MVAGTVEVIRDLPRNLGLAVFVDAGNAFNDVSEGLEYSAGIGLRFRLPIATVGFDIAQALSVSGATPRLHVNFSPKL
jgi:translocation and assembly module TamA